MLEWRFPSPFQVPPAWDKKSSDKKLSAEWELAISLASLGCLKTFQFSTELARERLTLRRRAHKIIRLVVLLFQRVNEGHFPPMDSEWLLR